jgi:hypothetical protein
MTFLVTMASRRTRRANLADDGFVAPYRSSFAKMVAARLAVIGFLTCLRRAPVDPVTRAAWPLGRARWVVVARAVLTVEPFWLRLLVSVTTHRFGVVTLRSKTNGSSAAGDRSVGAFFAENRVLLGLPDRFVESLPRR